MLTRKQHDLLNFINKHLTKDGIPPSFDEMKEALDLRSKSGIHRLITALEERGFIRRLAHRARAIEIVKLPDSLNTTNKVAQLQTNLTANSPSVVEAEIKHAGIGFMMAPMHHPATRHVMPIRQELGCKTIFNILGPLTNPAGVKRQLSGAFAPDLLFPMAETLDTLGCEKAWLVHGSDGTDELTIVGSSSVVELVDGKISSFEIHPEDAGWMGSSCVRL